MEEWKKKYNVNDEDIKGRRRRRQKDNENEETLEDYWQPRKTKGGR